MTAAGQPPVLPSSAGPQPRQTPGRLERATPAAGISSLSCAGPGDRSAIGNSEAATGPFGAFGASEVNGVWGQLQHLPGIPFFDDANGEATISCTAPGDCAAGGIADGKDGRYSRNLTAVYAGGLDYQSSLLPPGRSRLPGKTAGWAAGTPAAQPGGSCLSLRRADESTPSAASN